MNPHYDFFLMKEIRVFPNYEKVRGGARSQKSLQTVSAAQIQRKA